MMFWKLFFVVEVLAAAGTFWLIGNWQISDIVVVAVTLLRVLAVYTYAFDATQYSTTGFWSGFRYVYVGCALLTVVGYVISLTAGFRFGIFPKVTPVYVLDVVLGTGFLATQIWAEWTVIKRLAHGLTARTHAANSWD